MRPVPPSQTPRAGRGWPLSVSPWMVTLVVSLVMFLLGWAIGRGTEPILHLLLPCRT